MELYKSNIIIFIITIIIMIPSIRHMMLVLWRNKLSLHLRSQGLHHRQIHHS